MKRLCVARNAVVRLTRYSIHGKALLFFDLEDDAFAFGCIMCLINNEDTINIKREYKLNSSRRLEFYFAVI